MAEAIDVGGVVAEVRKAAGPEMVPSRHDAESQARALLDQRRGRMAQADAKELAHLLNQGYWGTGMRFNRFLPGLSDPLVNQMTEDLDHFNQVTYDLWRGEEAAALDTAGRIFEDPKYLPGSGRSYPTMLLYLRDPEKYAVWFKRLDAALAAVTDYPGHARTTGIRAYLDYCQHASDFRSEHGLDTVELDAVLAEISRRLDQTAAEARGEASIPTIPRAAFEFMADLAVNNNKEWLNANRARYEGDLRDPIAEVFEYIAANYLRALDPKLLTEVKRDVVLARLNKWSSGDPYYEHYWGAFSRGKKQEDVQLFINIRADVLRFGLYLGSAPPGARELIASAARSGGDSILSAIEAAAPLELTWESFALRNAVAVRSGEELAEWAESSDPEVGVHLGPDDPLIGSSDLAEVIAQTMVALHPLAAIAWGDEIDIELQPVVEADTSRPEYTFEDLVADTHLAPEQLEEWIALLRSREKRAGLFFGPPGTGKTWVAQKIARYLAGTEGADRTVQFHPSFSYEDFIEGLRPETVDGQLSYVVRPGVFKKFCDEARGRKADFVFVVDEINRAELGSVLGEVMMLIEYRGRTVPLPYSQEPFSIPDNVVLLATMNTADRSLALVDFALRRRFHAFRMPPLSEVIKGHHGENGALAIRMFDLIQEYVNDEDFAPGHSYWMTTDVSSTGLERIWQYEIHPYLAEYWFESRERLDELRQKVFELLAEDE